MIDPVVGLDQLQAYGDRVILADVRYYLDGRSGRAAYEQGHLPGAVFVDMDHDLAAHDAPPEAGRHPLPDPATFAARMSALGIGDADTVVAYDDAGGVMAARLVWMLRALDVDAALLNGGLSAYAGDLESGPAGRTAARFDARPWPAQRLATIDDAVAAGADPSAVLIDARPRDRFRGENETLDPRAGHIPGARNVPCRENVGSDGRLLPVAELRERFVAAGVDGEAEVVSYCGSGVTACHNLVVLEHAGWGPGRLFAGSWSAYAHTDRPVETRPDRS